MRSKAAAIALAVAFSTTLTSAAVFMPQEAQTRYESQIASSIADLLERTTPNAGPETDAIAKPVQTVQKASPQ